MQRSEFLEHITGPGERWDTIAYRYYNDAEKMNLLIEANRDLFLGNLAPIPAVLSSGLTLRIPVIEQPAVDEALLPPWKRGKTGA